MSYNKSVERSFKPFIKWAGGKGQMLPALISRMPSHYNKYIEPFIGGGAMFFALNHEHSIISDLNEELIITYNQIKFNVHEVINHLRKYENTEEFFYNIRSIDISSLTHAEIAARLIYLNKTCFNGLYRVNKKGGFNVPYGKKMSPFLNESNLLNASLGLKDAIIIHGDYHQVLSQYAEKDDFIFLDPPYHPLSTNSDFKRYTKESFYENDQIILAERFKDLVTKGCKVLLTNSDHPFVLDLYKEFQIEIIETKRLINKNPNKRTGRDIIVKGGY